MQRTLTLRAGILSLALLAVILLGWQVAVSGTAKTEAMDPEYAALMGQSATTGKSAMPGPLDVGATIWGTCCPRWTPSTACRGSAGPARGSCRA